jgi:hypothetical protein
MTDQLPGIPERPVLPPPVAAPPEPAAFDPLKLCIFATVALLTWILGPIAVLGFALLGVRGYVRARRAGLTRTKCYLRDVRLTLLYLGTLAVVSAGAIAWRGHEFLGG